MSNNEMPNGDHDYFPNTRFEQLSETFIFHARWLLLPAYIAAALSLFALSADALLYCLDLFHYLLLKINGRLVFLELTYDAAKWKDFSVAVTTLKIVDHLLLGMILMMVGMVGFRVSVGLSPSNVVLGLPTESIQKISEMKSATAGAIGLVSCISLLGRLISEASNGYFNPWWVVGHIALVATALAYVWLERLHRHN